MANAVKENILQYLYEKYGMIEEDFISAEIEIVPAGRTRDFYDRTVFAHHGAVHGYYGNGSRF